MAVCQQRTVDGPCWGRGPTPAERSIGRIRRESGIQQGSKSRTRAALAPPPSGSPELPGCTRRAGSGREDAQHLAPAAGLSPGPASPAPAILGFPQLPAMLSEAGRLLCRAQGSFATWVGEGKEGEGRELVLEQGPGWQRKTCGACSHSLHPRSDTAFCRGFFAEWDPRSLSVF